MDEDPSEILGSAAANLFRRASSATPPPLGADTPAAEPTILQFIVQEVNKVLQTNYSLVEFDSRKGRALLQILSDVLATLSPSMKADLTAEDPQATGPRLAEFLCGILNYRPAESQPQFIDALCTGDEAVVYPILHWVLSHMPENAKRVYLAQYLIPVLVPEDMIASDDEIREVYQHYRALVDGFKDAHKVVDKLAGQGKAESTANSVAQLEVEKELLTQKIEAAKKKLAPFGNQEALFKACQVLRKQKDEEQLLLDRMNEQLALSKLADQRTAQAIQKQGEMKKFSGDLDVEKLLRSLSDENALLSLMLTDKLPQEISQCRLQCEALEKISSTSTESLNKAVYQLEKDIQEIEDKSRPKLSPSEEQSLGLFRQQAAVVASRKEKFKDELKALKDQRQKFQDALSKRQVELSQHHGSKILRGEEFKQYANSLRGKSTQYKKLKSELQELRTELGVVQRTEDILSQRSASLDSSIAAVEKMKGITGFRSMKDNLALVSENKAEIDEAKNQTLEELSKVVSDFVTTIRNKRNKLAPQIDELHGKRTRIQMLEQELMQKKELYDLQKGELDAELARLQAEVDQLTEEWKQSETVYHRINCQITLLEASSARAKDEKDFRSGSRALSKQHPSYTEMLEQQILHFETQTRDLRNRKKELEESHGSGVEQMRWFKDLLTLLESKVAYYKRQALGQGVTQGLAGVVVGVDRLVL
eukprot:RCo004426